MSNKWILSTFAMLLKIPARLRSLPQLNHKRDYIGVTNIGICRKFLYTQISEAGSILNMRINYWSNLLVSKLWTVLHILRRKIKLFLLLKEPYRIFKIPVWKVIKLFCDNLSKVIQRVFKRSVYRASVYSKFYVEHFPLPSIAIRVQ